MDAKNSIHKAPTKLSSQLIKVRLLNAIPAALTLQLASAKTNPLKNRKKRTIKFKTSLTI